MRICILENETKELDTFSWINEGRPEVIGCSSLQTQESFKHIDWSKDVSELKSMLSKDEILLGNLSDYIAPVSRRTEHQFRNYSYHFKLVNYLLDWAFDCGWTGELEKLKQKVEEVIIEDDQEENKAEELDALSNEELDLNKLKFIEDETITSTETNKPSQNLKGEEEGVDKISSLESSKSDSVLQKPRKRRARSKKRS